MTVSKTKEYRKELAEAFANVLDEKQLDWKKGWKGLSNRPINATNEKKYRGINAFYLMIIMQERGYKDPRFATYVQIQKMGWSLKNAHGMGVKVEYWFPYDREEKRALTWPEFKLAGGAFGERYYLKSKYSTVFNAEHIEGIPAMEEPKMNDIHIDALVNTLSKNMGVEILNDGGDRAFYRPNEDKIHLPVPGAFESDYDYNSTALHELAHSTGAANRLNRNLSGSFGSPAYAFEELVAEITSCFMSFEIEMEQNSYHVDNHKAYVQSWADAIREKPEVLVRAIAEAEKAASYMDYKADLIPKEEYQKTLESSREVNAAETEKNIEPEMNLETDIKKLQEATERLKDTYGVLQDSLARAVPNFGTEEETNPQIVMDLDDYLREKGVDSPFGPYQDDKLIGHVKVLRQKSTKKNFENTSKEYWAKREQAKEEYNQMVQEGVVRPSTPIERTISKANGHPDNPSTQAARRMAEKRGYDWKTGQPLAPKL